jgi:hypothetical protein
VLPPAAADLRTRVKRLFRTCKTALRDRVATPPRTVQLSASPATDVQRLPPSAQSGLLIATTHHLLLLDADGDVRVVHSGAGLYYGLANDGAHIYAACRRNDGLPSDASGRQLERGSVLVLDGALQVVRTAEPPFALRDLHGSAVCSDRLWVTCSYDDKVARWDPNADAWDTWQPLPTNAREQDKYHWNSITEWPDGSLALVAHNHGRSEIHFFDPTTLALLRSITLGYQAHDTFLVDGAPATCSSGEGHLRSTNGWALRTGAFPRGLAEVGDHRYLGVTPVAPREGRRTTSPVIRRLTRDWGFAGDLILPQAGMLLALLPVSYEASADLPPVWRQGTTWSCEPVAHLHSDEYFPGRDHRPLPPLDWHEAESEHCWTAAREARLPVVVNPDDTLIECDMVLATAETGTVEVRLGQDVLAVVAGRAGRHHVVAPLPAGVQGDATLHFLVEALWCPAASGSTDSRELGVGVRSVRFRRDGATRAATPT